MQLYNQTLDRIRKELIDFNKNECFVVGIDGNCGSGKTTLSDILSKKLKCEVIHMDDFFLPIDVRTKERLNQIAGNVHYERFQNEVINHIKSGHLEYKVFDCSTMKFSKSITINPKRLLIIEGSYSFSNNFHQAYNLKIFTKCNPKSQIKRLRNRVGEEKTKLFIDKWIPMEENYFEHYNTEELADIIIDTSDIF